MLEFVHKYAAVVALLGGLSLFGWIVFLFQRDEENEFDLKDLVLDHGTNRASLPKTIILAFSAVSIWVVVVKTMGIYKDGGAIEGLLLGLLGIFVGQLAVIKGLDTWKDVTKKEGP